MKYLGRTVRHEIKYYICERDYFNLRKLLQVIAEPDVNMKEEGYLVSSVYFDDIYHSALEEKRAGVQFRKKYRLRCYNREDKLIRLECKQKYGDYTAKESEEFKRTEYDAILKDEYDFLLEKGNICRELYAVHHSRLLKPVIAVEYFREAYIFKVGNVRITFDKGISFSVGDYDVFSEYYSVCRALQTGVVVMEVKYDEFLPSAFLQTLLSVTIDRCAISKYTMCLNEKGRYM